MAWDQGNSRNKGCALLGGKGLLSTALQPAAVERLGNSSVSKLGFKGCCAHSQKQQTQPCMLEMHPQPLCHLGCRVCEVNMNNWQSVDTSSFAHMCACVCHTCVLTCRDRVTVSQQLGELLDGLLEPVAEDRFTPQEAINVATGRAAKRRKTAAAAAAAAVKQPQAASQGQVVRLPDGSLFR